MSALLKLVVVSAGASDPSSTAMLADRLAARTLAGGRERGVEIAISTIELRTLANEIAAGLVSQVNGPGLKAATQTLAESDGIIAATPIYKAGVSGLFKSFFDLLDNDLLIAKPVAMAATAGTARHALVVDEAMRSLFAYMRALTVPTALFAATEDWADPALEARIERTALELGLLMESRLAEQIRDRSWGSYQHKHGSAGDAATLQGHPASSFIGGNGQIIGNTVQIAVGQKEVPVLNIPGFGPLSASCQTGGKGKAEGGFKFVNASGAKLSDSLQYDEGSDGGTLQAGDYSEVGGFEVVASWRWTFSTLTSPPRMVTLDLSFNGNGTPTACLLAAQATISG